MNKKINSSETNVYVTQPYLPPLEEFIPYLEEIWDNKILTNCGPFHHQLENELCEYLGVKHISLFTNATIALVTALQALRITGEVWTSHATIDKLEPQIEARSNASGLTPPRWLWRRVRL
jgi:dTDP-4-amino-4,6-dideoxygalactose transaminase